MLSQNKSKIKLLQLVLLIAISTQAYAQVQIKSVNAGISIGSVNGNSLPFTAFGGKISSDFNLWFSDEVSFQFGFEHSRKIEYYLPENRTGKVYPFINYYFLKALLNQKYYKRLFLEEGVGLLLLNDRTFSDTNIWEYGGTFSISTGIDFRNELDSGFTVSAGINYGITINSTTVSFSLITFQAKYFF